MPVTSALWEAEAALTVPACGFYFCLHVRLEHFYGIPLNVLQYMYTVRAQSKTLTSKGLLKRQHYQPLFKEKVKARKMAQDLRA